MNTIRTHISNFLYWISMQIHDFASWIQPPFDFSNLSKEEKQEIRRWFEEN